VCVLGLYSYGRHEFHCLYCSPIALYAYGVCVCRCTFAGPLLILDNTATILVEPGCTMRVNDCGHVEIQLGEVCTICGCKKHVCA